MGTLISRSPEETFTLGERWGREAQRGWVIGLSGDLGAGKTQLVKGIAHGLGSSARVHSPTFALLNQYGGGRWPLFHLDLFRLDTHEAVLNAGLEEYLDQPSGVTVVEWIERWLSPGEQAAAKGRTRMTRAVTRLVTIDVVSEMERRITYEDSGA